MIVKEIRENVYWAQFPTRYHVCSALMRMSEFSESPFPHIRGKYFTHEQCIDAYAENNPDKRAKNKFTYFEDVDGFNIKGKVLLKFGDMFNGDLWDKELKVLEWVSENHNKGDDFYFIATFKGPGERQTLRHEIAHAYYYLYPSYRRSVKELLKDIGPRFRKKLDKWLEGYGYAEPEFDDELHAYLSTNHIEFWENNFNTPKNFCTHILMTENLKTFDAKRIQIEGNKLG